MVIVLRDFFTVFSHRLFRFIRQKTGTPWKAQKSRPDKQAGERAKAAYRHGGFMLLLFWPWNAGI
jgi:hypothetical protein